MNVLVIMGKNKIGMLRTIQGIDKQLSDRGYRFGYFMPEVRFIDEIGFNKDRIKTIKGMTSLRKFPEIIRGLYGLLTGRRAIKRWNIDLIYNYTLSTLPYCMILSRMSGTPYITAVRNVYEGDGKRFKKYFLHKARNILAVSEDTMRHVETYLGGRDGVDNKSVVYNGIDLNYFNRFIDCARPDEFTRFKSEDVVIGMVSAMNPEKDPQFLLRAGKRIVEKCPNAKFVFIGRFPDEKYEKETLALRDALSLQNNAFFLGYQNPIGPYFAHMNILVHPTLREEAFGLVLAEAMFFGSPVVASRIGAIPEVVIDGETGILCAPGDEDEFVEAVTKLVKDRNLLDSMGQKSALRVRAKFSMERLASNLDVQFEKVVTTWDNLENRNMKT